MKRIAFALLSLFLSAEAQAQTKFTMPPPAGVSLIGLQVVSSCGAAAGLIAGNTAFAAMDTTGNLCTNATGGGGGGGLSVIDQATWTQGTSPFTPTGCVFNDAATLSSGQQGTVRCTTDRQFKVLDSAVLAAVQSPIPPQSPAVPIGGVSICDGANGATNPCTTPATVKPASTPAAATDKAIVVDQRPGTNVTIGPYPAGATPYTATATGTTAATTATLAGASSVTTYICGFSIRANATAAATGNATVTGVITATLNFTQWTAPLASGLGITEMIFAPCIPASGTNQSVAVVSAAPGSGGVVSVTAWGYKL